MRKHFVLLLALVLCIGLLAGCSTKETSAPHTHTDLTIRLPLDYLDLSDASFATQYDFMYGMEPIVISGLRDEKSMFADWDLDIENYGFLVMELNGLDRDLLQTDGIWNFTYEAEGYTYLIALYETTEAFWTVQTYCPTEKYSVVSDVMWEILKSITV